MSRKLVSLALVLMLMLTAVVYAAGIGPSKQNGDLTQVETPANAPAGFSINTKAETDYSKEVFDKFNTLLKAGGKAIDFFPSETVEAIRDQLSFGFDVDTLEINEFMPLTVDGYDYSCPDLTIKFAFPTKYAREANLVVLVGYASEDGEDTQWIVAPHTINIDGSIDITFDTDTLSKVASGDAVLTVLSETQF